MHEFIFLKLFEKSYTKNNDSKYIKNIYVKTQTQIKIRILKKFFINSHFLILKLNFTCYWNLKKKIWIKITFIFIMKKKVLKFY